MYYKILLFLCCGYASLVQAFESYTLETFTDKDITFLRSFTLSALPSLPRSNDNIFADNIKAANLGKSIFFDTDFSANKKVSCASCHQPKKYFTDGLKVGEGLSRTRRNTLSILGSSYGPWKYWDGRKDSLWSQALEPLENINEHGFSRVELYALIKQKYSSRYEVIFGEIGDSNKVSQTRVLVNVGKSLMAYQRQLKLYPSRFDLFVNDLSNKKNPNSSSIFSKTEIQGLRLFMGRAGCASCHNGPLFTNFEFHNIGSPEPDIENVDLGRYEGIMKLRDDEFNCLSQWSDAKKSQCEELNYLKKQGPELVGAFKTPSLRNVAETAPYMHSGQINSLKSVLEHYNTPAPPYYNREQHPNRPHFDILPLNLSASEQKSIIAFLKTLTSPLVTHDTWWAPPK